MSDKSTGELKAIIFDVDGVISDTAALHYQAWKDTVKPLGIDFTPEENLPLKGLPRLDTLLAILEIHKQTGRYSADEIKALTELKNDTYVKLLKAELRPDDILPGVINFIRDAKNAGLRLAVASTSVNSPFILGIFGVLKHFDFIVEPKTVSRGKPDPEIFLKACSGVGALPSECLGIEDALPGIAALKAAGIKSIAITHGDKGDWSSALAAYDSTASLKFSDAERLFKGVD